MSDKSFLSLDQKTDNKTGKFPAMENNFPQGELSFTKHRRHNQAVLFWWAEWVYVCLTISPMEGEPELLMEDDLSAEGAMMLQYASSEEVLVSY